jgi:hypothetical protein
VQGCMARAGDPGAISVTSLIGGSTGAPGPLPAALSAFPGGAPGA